MTEEKDIKHNKHKEEVDELRKELELCRKKSEEYLNGWKRAKADYINFKKETEKKNLELVQFATAGLILELLPIIDDIKQAVNHISQENKDKDWVIGFLNIKKKFDNLLKSIEITEIKTVGEKFDPMLHEAVAKEKSEGREAGIIIKEVSGGYKMQDKVIRPAKVIVSE